MKKPIAFEFQNGIAFGELARLKISIGPTFEENPATSSNGSHIAFCVSDRAMLDVFFESPIANDGIDEGKPGLRLQYHANYYGAYVRDPDGNKIQAACHAKQG